MCIEKSLVRFIIVLLALVFFAYAPALNLAPSLAAVIPWSEAHKDIDRLYELAVKGEGREAAIEGIRAYVASRFTHFC